MRPTGSPYWSRQPAVDLRMTPVGCTRLFRVSTSRVLHGFLHGVIKGATWATLYICLHPIGAAIATSPHVSYKKTQIAYNASVGCERLRGTFLPIFPPRLIPFSSPLNPAMWSGECCASSLSGVQKERTPGHVCILGCP